MHHPLVRGSGFWLLVAVLAAVGCREPRAVPPTKLSDSITGLKVNATVDGPAFVKKSDKMITVFAQFSNKISVNQDQVGYNGVQIAELPKGTSEVDLTITPSEITIVANGQHVATVPVPASK